MEAVLSSPAVSRYAGLIRFHVKNETMKRHQERWDFLHACRQSKDVLVGSKARNTKFLLSLSRAKLRVLIGVLTGHTSLNYYLHKIGIVNDPICRGFGFEPETAKHFLCTCPALRNLWIRHLRDSYITPEKQTELDLADVTVKVKIFKKKINEEQNAMDPTRTGLRVPAVNELSFIISTRCICYKFKDVNFLATEPFNKINQSIKCDV